MSNRCVSVSKTDSLKLDRNVEMFRFNENKIKKTRFTETQIVRTLKEGEEGRKTENICHELEISKATFYNWKSHYGGIEVSDVTRLKELEKENARLKKMFAELSMYHGILKRLSQRKVGALVAKIVNPGDCSGSRFKYHQRLQIDGYVLIILAKKMTV